MPSLEQNPNRIFLPTIFSLEVIHKFASNRAEAILHSIQCRDVCSTTSFRAQYRAGARAAF